MPTEITQEMVNSLRSFLTIKQIKGKIVTVFADDAPENVIGRLETYDMIKDEYTREDMYEFLNHFARLLELDLGTYTSQDLDRVMLSIVEGEVCCTMGLDVLANWFAINPFTRETYVNDALDYLITMDDRDEDEIPPIQDILQKAKFRETLDVFDLGYNFIKWYLDIEEDEDE